MSVDQRDLYEIVHSKEQELADQYDSMPPVTSDIGIHVSSENAQGGAMLDYGSKAIYLDPAFTYFSRDKLEDIAEHGIRHLEWHPNHGRGFRTSVFDRRNFYGTEGVEDHEPMVMGELTETDTETAVRDIYRSAVNEFKDIFETEFTEPRIIVDEEVTEYSERRDEDVPVGYEIDSQNDQIILNDELIHEMHPQLLNEDFRYMLKRYHDLSAEQTVREKAVPYVENLRPEAELGVQDVVFKHMDGSTRGAYNPGQSRMKLDYSLLSEFDPVTGQFDTRSTGMTGAATLLHEGVHDLDFSVNDLSRDYLNAVSDKDNDHPRNAVLEAPTTFEVFMAGWERRPSALNAFEEPLDNLEFFRDYPAEDMESSESDSIAYPYNMGLITSLSIHKAMMDEHGVERGTEATRDIIYGNAWDLKHMGLALESAFEKMDVPNIPRHRREVTSIAEEGEEAVLDEAERILDEYENNDLDVIVRGGELLYEYEQDHSVNGEPGVLDDLDRLVYQLKRQSDEL